jgi:hypothetical protein
MGGMTQLLFLVLKAKTVAYNNAFTVVFNTYLRGERGEMKRLPVRQDTKCFPDQAPVSAAFQPLADLYLSISRCPPLSLSISLSLSIDITLSISPLCLSSLSLLSISTLNLSLSQSPPISFSLSRNLYRAQSLTFSLSLSI